MNEKSDLLLQNTVGDIAKQLDKANQTIEDLRLDLEMKSNENRLLKQQMQEMQLQIQELIEFKQTVELMERRQQLDQINQNVKN